MWVTDEELIFSTAMLEVVKSVLKLFIKNKLFLYKQFHDRDRR